MKCRYCGKTCSVSYCNEICSAKAEQYDLKVSKVKVSTIIILVLADIVVTLIAMILASPIGLGIMIMGFGLIFLFYPYVTEETLTVMSIRSSLILMRTISAVSISVGAIIIGWNLLM